jgi:hypothetical protein
MSHTANRALSRFELPASSISTAVAVFDGLFSSLAGSGDFALGLRIALLQVGLEHAQPGVELFEVLFGVLDRQTLGGAVPDHALLRLDVGLELFYFGDQLRFDLLHADQPPDAGTVPSLDTVSALPTRKPQLRNATTLRSARPARFPAARPVVVRTYCLLTCHDD